MINKIFSILYKDFKIEINQSHLFFSVGLYVISSIYIIYISYQPTGILGLENWVSIFWVIILFSSISAVSKKSFFQESGSRNYYYYFVLSPDELILSKLIYNFLFYSFCHLSYISGFFLFARKLHIFLFILYYSLICWFFKYIKLFNLDFSYRSPGKK